MTYLCLNTLSYLLLLAESMTDTTAVKLMDVEAGDVLAKTVMVLACGPALPLVLNFILIDDVSPGATGSRGHSEAVQPHETPTLFIMSGNSPAFLKL